MTPSVLFRPALVLACALLAACASSTMDSIPDQAKMEQYKIAARAGFEGDYARLVGQRDSGLITLEEYNRQIALLEDRVVERANNMAWESHQMAEQQRVAQSIPTPSSPQNLPVPSAMRGGAGGMSNYRSSLSQYSNMSGVGGGGTVSSSLQNTGALSTGGTLATPNYPGSIYDTPANQ